MKSYLKVAIFFAGVLSVTCTEKPPLNGIKILSKIFEDCAKKEDVYKCFKMHVLKIADRLTKLKNINLMDGVEFVENGKQFREGRKISDYINAEAMEDNKINEIIWEKVQDFLDGHRLQLSLSEEDAEDDGKAVGRRGGRRRRRRYLWPLLYAFAIKMLFMAVSYKAIAAMAGTALIVGKIALVLSAILGLKKLIKGNEQKTTFEIVKQPYYSSGHSYSSSFDEDPHYHRSLNSGEDNAVMERIYGGQRQ